jgi:hypothetical protein
MLLKTLIAIPYLKTIQKMSRSDSSLSQYKPNKTMVKVWWFGWLPIEGTTSFIMSI